LLGSSLDIEPESSMIASTFVAGLQAELVAVGDAPALRPERSQALRLRRVRQAARPASETSHQPHGNYRAAAYPLRRAR
jgi:hypothetical protein